MPSYAYLLVVDHLQKFTSGFRRFAFSIQSKFLLCKKANNLKNLFCKEIVSIGSGALCLHSRKNWLVLSKMVSGLGHTLSAPMSCLMVYSFGRSLVAVFLVIDDPARAGAFLIGVIVSFSTLRILTTSSHNLQTRVLYHFLIHKRKESLLKVHRNLLDALLFTERMHLEREVKIEVSIKISDAIKNNNFL